jgi:predicted Zn-ribbon and HTH transcriptional regulator
MSLNNTLLDICQIKKIIICKYEKKLYNVSTAHMKQTYMLCVSPTWCTKCPAHRHEDAIVKNSHCVTSGFKTSTFLLAATQYRSFTLCFRREPVCRWHVWTPLCSHVSCHSCCYTPPGTKWTDRNALKLILTINGGACECKRMIFNWNLNTDNCVMYNIRSSVHCCTVHGSCDT